MRNTNSFMVWILAGISSIFAQASFRNETIMVKPIPLWEAWLIVALIIALVVLEIRSFILHKRNKVRETNT